MKLAIMQPYFFPYIGYFQLINAVDKFVIYDNIKYTKKGWINRNRILVNNKDSYITLPLKSDSDFLDIKDRYLAKTWPKEKQKLINRLKSIYKDARYFRETINLIERILNWPFHEGNLFKFLLYSLQTTCEYLEIKTEFVVSSSIPINHSLKAQDKVIAICKALGATQYINPRGGVELYQKEEFIKAGIELSFLFSENITYKQFSEDFVPWLSIIDIMMFNSRDSCRNMLSKRNLR